MRLETFSSTRPRSAGDAAQGVGRQMCKHALEDLEHVVGALLVDADGIHDPARTNDRLLPGMKGTIGKMELASFRQRAHEAMKQ